MNLIDHFDKGAEEDPARICVRDGRTAKTYAEVQVNSCRIANAINAMGFDPGAKIAVLSENSASAFECLVGILRAGCVWVPVGPNQSMEDTIAMLDNSDVELLLYTHGQRTTAIEIVSRCGSLRKAAVIDVDDSSLPSLPLMMAEASEADPRIHRGPDDLVTLIGSGEPPDAPRAS